MDENHQDTAGSKLKAIGDKLWLPPSYINWKSSISPVPRKRGINWGFKNRTMFDWMLLISQVLGAIAIPFVVLVVGLYATQQITLQQAQSSEKQHQTDLQIAADQQRAATLQTCIDDIKDLLLNHNLRSSKAGDEVSIVARAEVLLTLRQLDRERKGALVQFLSEASLITDNGNDAIVISLSGADLDSADLRGADLRGANLDSADLTRADLRGSDLHGAALYYANLIDTNLSDAELTGANLTGADLIDANLDGADLDGADLTGADLTNAELTNAELTGAILYCASVTQRQLVSARSLVGATNLHASFC